MVGSLKNQLGAVIPNYVAILMMVAVGAWYALEDSQTAVMEQQGELVQSMKGQVMQRINALQSCYNVERVWCQPDDLLQYGLSASAINDSFVIDQVTDGDDVKVTVQAPSINIAQAFAKHVIDPQINGPQVTFTVQPPTNSNILKNQVQRYADTVNNRNSLETNIEMGNKNVENFNIARGAKGEFRELKANLQQTKNLEVTRELSLGANNIAFDAGKVSFGAQKTSLQGSAEFDGDIQMNNTNITGIDSVDASSIEATDFSAQASTINNLKGDRIDYNNADIESITAYKYTSNSYKAEQLKVGTLNAGDVNANVRAKQGNIETLRFDTANGADWNYNTGQTNTLSSSDSSLGAASAQNLAVTSDLRGEALTANLGQFTSLNILGHTSGGEFNAVGDFVSSRSSVNNNYTSLSSQASSIDGNRTSIQATGNDIASTTNDVTSNTNNKNKNKTDIQGNKNTILDNSGSISDNRADIDTVADSLDSSAEELGLWKDRLDKCMYQTQYCIPQDPSLSLSCSDCSQEKAQPSFSATAFATISACRQGCSYSWEVSSAFAKAGGTCLSGSVPIGGSATPSCKVSKSNLLAQEVITGAIKIKVNNSHYTERSDSKTVAVRFKNTTVPNPIVNTSCSGCNTSRTSNSFSALVSSSISNCPQGCDYSWSISGGASGSCASGSVTAGGSAAPSCSLSGTVTDASTMAGTVSIIVKNSVSTSYSDQDSEPYRWQNTTPSDPFKSVFAGCYVDTVGFDSVQRNSCYNDGFRSQGQPGKIVFSVGNRTRNTESYYFTSDINASISWSGDCSGTSNMCSIVKQCFGSRCPAIGVKRATAHVTINGVTKAFTVTGSDLSRVDDGTGPR